MEQMKKQEARSKEARKNIKTTRKKNGLIILRTK